MRRVIVFNWPKLVAGAAMVAGSGAAATWLATRWPVRLALVAVAITTSYWLITSLAVSWWVYDRSDLHDWSWLQPLLPPLLPPLATRWALVHAGFDEAGPALPAALAALGKPGAVIDISSRLARTSPSLRRAQRRGPSSQPAAGPGIMSDCARLPLCPGGLDAMVLVFAAHEVRDRRQRADLFDELRGALAPGGRVILVEHLRDGANIAAFGPGAWHFQTRRTWVDVAELAGFHVAGEVRQTHFVHGLALCRPEARRPEARRPEARRPEARRP